jgi:SAM-dependent methyltransferase
MQSCHVCGGRLETLLAEVAEPETLEKFSIMDCRACGAGHSFSQPSDLGAYYAGYHGKRHGFTANFCARRRVRWLEKMRKPARSKGDVDEPFDAPLLRAGFRKHGRVLDIGCGEGTFLKEAKERGWNVVGTELNAERFADSGLDVYEDLDSVKARFGKESFGAVTMWHTLEHFRNPREVLRDAFELLAPGGSLLVAVPDAGGWQARLFGKYWLHRDVPRHLFHFSFKSLEQILGQSGFAVKNKWHQEFEYDLLGWSQSALNTVFRTPNVFFNTLSGKRSNAGRAAVAANFMLGTVLSAFALPLVLLGTLSGKGGTIIVSAVKAAEKEKLSTDAHG